MHVLMYRSDGMDEMAIACRTVEEAVNCFRADAETMLKEGRQNEIELWREEMTDEQLANWVEA